MNANINLLLYENFIKKGEILILPKLSGVCDNAISFFLNKDEIYTNKDNLYVSRIAGVYIVWQFTVKSVLKITSVMKKKNIKKYTPK